MLEISKIPIFTSHLEKLESCKFPRYKFFQAILQWKGTEEGGQEGKGEVALEQKPQEGRQHQTAQVDGG